MEKPGSKKPYSLQSEYTYLDYNATTPLCSGAIEDMQEVLQLWGNPSSIHWAGRGPKTLLREARKSVSNYLGVHPLELVLTSGGSEANNLAIKGSFEWLKETDPQRNHYICSQVEHPSVLKTFEYLESLGAKVDYIPVSREGVLDVELFESLVTEKTALVSVMFANNETGHIFPIKKLVKIAHKSGALFHCDAVQALGKALIDIKSLDVDLCTFSGHKAYAPKGCGILYMRKGLKLPSLIHGGAQERGRRAGTENVYPFVAFSRSIESFGDLTEKIKNMEILRDKLEALVLEKIDGVKITGQGTKRIPNTSSLVLQGVGGESLLMSLDVKGYAVSTGAACSSGSPEPSPVLLNMGLSREEAQSSLRLSLGFQTSLKEIESFVEVLVKVVERLRGHNE